MNVNRFDCMAHEGPWLMNNSAKTIFINTTPKYNNDHALNWNDYGARWYDPAIRGLRRWIRWRKKMASWSPFAYGFNNPLKIH